MRAYFLALAILSSLGCICFAIAQGQAYRGPDCTQFLHPDCETFARNNSADLVADNSRYGGYRAPVAIDDPDDPESPDNN